LIVAAGVVCETATGKRKSFGWMRVSVCGTVRRVIEIVRESVRYCDKCSTHRWVADVESRGTASTESDARGQHARRANLEAHAPKDTLLPSARGYNEEGLQMLCVEEAG